jgi:hypothetical protein
MLFEAFHMSLLVGVFSYALYALSHRGGYSNSDGTVKRKPKISDDTGLKQDRKTGHFAIDKWLALGGGYYGTVALVKLALSEVIQAFEFLSDWEGVLAYFADFDFGTIVSFFINQLKTFISAIIWPADYIGDYSLLELIILLALTYGAYKWAQNLAKEQPE